MKQVIESLKPKIYKIRTDIYLLSRNKLTFVSLVFIVLLVVLAILAPYIVPYPKHISDAANVAFKLTAPCQEYLFGTDELGRDIFSRIIYGTRISLLASVFAVALAMLIGITLGAIAGALGGIVDDIIMRICDIFLSFPSLLLAIVIAAFAGPSLRNALIAIAISWWPWYARIVRGQAISLKERQFVKAARALGNVQSKIIFSILFRIVWDQLLYRQQWIWAVLSLRWHH